MLVAGITAHSPWPFCFAAERVRPGSLFYMTSPGSFHSPGVADNGDGPTPQVDRMQQRSAPWPVASLLARRGNLFGAAMMRTLDVVDVFLLAGAVVYFGLLVLRRI